jgi:glycosyltransferase involved in cell wall biosynthesis
MRVALVGTDIPDHSIEFAEMMADSCEILLCLPDRFFSVDRPKKKSRLEIDWVSFPRQRSLSNIPFLWRLSKRIKGWKPDLVHILNESNVWSWLLVAFLQFKPVITTVHDVTLHPGDSSSRRVPRLFARALIRRSDAIIVHGDALREFAIHHLPVSPERIFVAPLVSPHIPPDCFHGDANRTSALGEFRILFFGRIYEYKGLKYLFEAFSTVKAKLPGARLIIAGRGDDPLRYLQSKQILSSVDILDRFIPRQEVEKLFSEADLLVLPYIEASQSGPLMIAMAFGTPVVATDVGAMSEVVRSTGMGLIVPPQNAAALATAIIEIASNMTLRESLADNATAAFKGPFSHAEIGRTIHGIYREVLGQAQSS